MIEINLKTDEKDVIRTGDWFVDIVDNCLFVLVTIGPYQVCAIAIEKRSANRYKDSLKVSDVENITEEEMRDITGNLKYRKVNIQINEIEE